MNHKHSKRGFTLIELLVVVLIIGILAAVALPQYQKAVDKSRAAEVAQMVSSLKKAATVYMLSGADLTTNADIVPSLDMDISFLTIDESRMEPGSSYYCSKTFCYGVNCGGGSVDIAAYPTGDPAAAGFFELHDYLYPNSDESWRECMYTRNDKRAENVCRSLVSEEELSPMG